MALRLTYPEGSLTALGARVSVRDRVGSLAAPRPLRQHRASCAARAGKSLSVPGPLGAASSPRSSLSRPRRACRSAPHSRSRWNRARRPTADTAHVSICRQRRQCCVVCMLDAAYCLNILQNACAASTHRRAAPSSIPEAPCQEQPPRCLPLVR
eukprot:3650243-Rhodomonas_salina.4